jgi:anti-sigma factor RsiW
MNGPCPQMQDQIADYVLGALDTQQAEALRAHLAGCEGCRQYAQSLKSQARSLVALGSQIEAGMEARQDKVVEALQNLSPAEAGRTRVFPFVGGFLRMAVAAVLVLGAGVGIGRWTAPRSVDVEQLRTDLQASIAASIAPAVQESILSQVDQRLQAGLSKNETKLRAELAGQVRDDLRRLTVQSTSDAEALVEKRFAELVQLVEEARLKDRQQVVKALEQMELNRYRDRTQIRTGLAALIEKKPAAVQQ